MAAASCERSSGAFAAIASRQPATRPWSGESWHTCSSPAGVLIALRPGGVFSGLWLVLIGWFLSTAAEATASEAGIEARLAGVTVRDAMDLTPPVVSPNETVAELVQDRLLRGENRSYLVQHDDGGLAGIVTLTDVRRVARTTGARRA